MKRYYLSMLLIFCAFSALAQPEAIRKIEVTGKSEMEIIPDEIYLAITLREYYKDNNNKNKVEMETLEKQLQKKILETGIPPTDFSVDNIDGNNYINLWRDKKKDPAFLARKRYGLKLNKLDKVNDILSSIDSRGIEAVNISGYSHSQMDRFNREMKIKAIHAAKEKAEYLLAAVGSRLGNVLEVYDIENYTAYYEPRLMMKAMAAESSSDMPNIDFKTIKIKAEVKTVFSIQ